MAIYKQEILTKAPDTTNGAPLPSVWKPVKDDGQTVVNKISFGLRATPNYSFKIGDAFEITVKTPVDITETELSIGIWVNVWSEGSEVNSIVASFPAIDSEKVNIEEQKKILAKLKTASPTNPVRFVLVVTKPGIISNFAYANNWLLDDGLFIDFKKVKALHVDGKNMKEFTIDGHLYNFRQANLPADEQTPLQELIDSYDWTHMSYTGKTLLENSLTVNDLSGFPALHTGIVVTAIANGVSSGGQFVVNLEFSRTLSNGDVEKAVKYGNICTFIEIKAAPLAVWYGDQNGNVYKNGVKTYLSLNGNQIKNIVSKGEDVWYSANSSGLGKVYKNGVEIYDGQTISTIAIDKDENVYYGGKDKNVYKNGTSIFTCSDWVQSIVIDKDGNWYAADQGRKLYKNGTEITSPSGTRIEKISVYKDGSILIGDYDGWLFENQTQLSKLSNQIFAVLYDKNKNKFAIANDSTLYKNQTSLYSGVYTSGDVSINSVNGDVYYTSTDKKIYKNGVAIYTSEGSYPVVSVNTEWGSRTGNWD